MQRKQVSFHPSFSLVYYYCIIYSRDLINSKSSRFQVREFVWDDQVAENQRLELEEANVSEKELWTELLRLARTNFSEAYMVLTHLKVIRSFVESVLRYGLPAEYFGVAVKVRKRGMVSVSLFLFLKTFSPFRIILEAKPKANKSSIICTCFTLFISSQICD